MRQLLVSIVLLLPLICTTTSMAQILTPHVNVTAEYSATPTNGFTIDICFIDENGSLGVGGKVGPDALIDQPVVLSHRARSLTPTTVNGDGTFLAVVSRNDRLETLLVDVGRRVTISIRPRGEAGGVYANTCVAEGFR
jgi:hypothetical protein